MYIWTFLLLGPDRLDKPLTIGQMQGNHSILNINNINNNNINNNNFYYKKKILLGKFQMEIFPECGHLMNEDAPDKLASVLNDFYNRNKVFIPKRFNIPLRPSNRATAPPKN